MQKFLAILAAVLLLAAHVSAQVTVELSFDQEQFLRDESLTVRLKISNFSGQPLRLGGSEDWLQFAVEAREGTQLAKSGTIPSAKPFTIESAKTATLRLDLMPHFKLSEPGHYIVSARVKVPQLGKELAAAPKSFNIVAGTKLWDREVGVPATTPPAVRRFALQQATFLKQLRLYARVTDASEEKVFNVVPLGALLSFSTPEPQIDRSSNLHVLFQTEARAFTYCVITPQGELIIRQTHEYTQTRPRLRAEEDGRVVVIGGQRKISLSDLPPPRVANSDGSSKSN
jgi:hypothetical protein